jgi:hypothetical protein
MGMLNLPVYLYTPAIRVFIDLENSTIQGVDKMYHGYATIAKGIKNTIRFTFVNGEQRAIGIDAKTFRFDLFDYVTNQRVLSKPLTILDDGTTRTLKGVAQLELVGNDTVELLSGQYTYAVLEYDLDNNELTPAFIDGASNLNGKVNLVDGVTARYRPSDELAFNRIQPTTTYSTGKVAANRDGRGHKNLHTAAFYFTDFTGTLNVYGSLNNSIDGDLGNWVLINSTVYTAQNGIDYTNLEGAFNYFKFEYVKTSGTIDKVLYRS